MGKTTEDLLVYLSYTQTFCVGTRKDLSVGPVLLTKDLLHKLLTAEPYVGPGVICYTQIPSLICGPGLTSHHSILSRAKGKIVISL